MMALHLIFNSRINILFALILLYNTGILLYAIAIRIAALFKEKARLFIKGRKNVFSLISEKLASEKRVRIWMHCASLGEFEQGRPVIEAIKESHPELCIILTFFSPSGYEIKKNYQYADHVFYLPLDSRSNAAKFIRIVNPSCALFVKYEFWYHYLATLHRLHIPVILFSAIFQPRHSFFKWYGSLHRKMLGFYRHIFVQDANSARLLESININNVTIVGDTRFDRAAQTATAIRNYPSIEQFKNSKRLLIAGSTWEEDELLLKQSMDYVSGSYQLLIAPHEVNETHIGKIRNLFRDKKVCLWEDNQSELKGAEVCIVNTIGHLSYLYRYADVVWVGGGFTKTGIHNIIEPAVYGVPICFGTNYSRYREAVDMLLAQAAHSVSDSAGFIAWLQNEKALSSFGNNAREYVITQLGATGSILHYLETEKCFFSKAKKF